MEKILDFLSLTVRIIMVLLAIAIEFPIKLTASISFIVLFLIATIFAPILRHAPCPKWWDVYGNYAIKWKNNWRLVTWACKNYGY